MEMDLGIVFYKFQAGLGLSLQVNGFPIPTPSIARLVST